MPFESFKPADPKYKKTEDLPKSVKNNFQDLPDGGFVRKEALAYQKAAEHQAEMRSRDGQSVTGLGLAEEEARRLEVKIQHQTTEAITHLETTLGQPLSEEARKEIYAEKASYGHHSETERYQLHHEQSTYQNAQLSQLAQEISSLSETEFKMLSREEKLTQLVSLAEFDRYVPNAEKAPALNVAAERLLRSYEPSEALETMHQKAHQEVLGALTPSETIDLAYGLEDYDEARSLALFQKIADRFAHAYGIEPVKVFIAEASHDDLEAAAFFSEDGRLGIVRKTLLLSSSKYDLPEFLAHEMAHAHQKKLTASETDSSFPIDAAWFALDEKLESVYGREFYVKNYPFIAKEQDARKAGVTFLESFRTMSATIRGHCNAFLKEQGFPSVEELFNRHLLVSKRKNFSITETFRRATA